jgi:hypothetical protein
VATVLRCARYTVQDTTSPSIVCAAPDGLWHAGDVLLPCTASDIGSGLANPADASFSLSTNVPPRKENDNAPTGVRTVCDKDDNCSQAGPIGGNKVDKKAPAIAIVQPAAKQYVHSAALVLDYTVEDGGSGVAQFTPTFDGLTTLGGHDLADGQTIDFLTELALGVHTFAVAASDKVGNASSFTVMFEIIVTADSIEDDVTRFLGEGAIKNAGLANSLLAKLSAAAEARARGDCARARNIYNAFMRQVTAQAGEGIDATAAAILIADVRYLIAHCP